jgi:sugar phosphate isomerase/epimerase
MRDLLGPGTRLGYCTNVVAGANWRQTQHNLEKHITQVRTSVDRQAPLGLGLWLSARSAREILQEKRLGALRDWLVERGFDVFTLNGFPHGDFHLPVVKHSVYEPDWREPARLHQTRDLATILAAILPEGEEGSISTLPVGWRESLRGDGDLPRAASNLRLMAQHLADLSDRTSHLIHLDLEPEPGCCLDRASDVVAFFSEHLTGHGDDELILRHLRICHDICHTAVMHEDQVEVLRTYREHGIRVGKVQISAAVSVAFESLSPERRGEALEQLREFHEKRYLHQTVIRTPDGKCEFHEDLPVALAAIADGANPEGTWRVHFHVPILWDHWVLIESTRREILPCLTAARELHDVHHFEIETYAWDVLPEGLRQPQLSGGIWSEIAELQRIIETASFV